VAVFPDRIVLKNSTDSRAAIEAAIGAGGADEIIQGEVVVGVESSAATLYTRATNGSIVAIGGGSSSGGGRGDGGDFSDGSVDVSFVMAVYGGGDFAAGTDDNPVELLNGNEGPDGGTF
jgi:hypothetical protein